MAFTREKKKKKRRRRRRRRRRERYNWLTSFTNLSDWTNGRILKGVLKE